MREERRGKEIRGEMRRETRKGMTRERIRNIFYFF